jgi:hypothetical protein
LLEWVERANATAIGGYLYGTTDEEAVCRFGGDDDCFEWVEE